MKLIQRGEELCEVRDFQVRKGGRRIHRTDTFDGPIHTRGRREPDQCTFTVPHGTYIDIMADPHLLDNDAGQLQQIHITNVNGFRVTAWLT